MKRKISDSEIRLIILLVSILMLAGSYFLGFNRFSSAAKELEAQNDIDQATVNNLESMVGRQAQVEQETEKIREEIADIVAKYPSDLTTEKAITIVQSLADYSGADIPNINFVMGSLLMQFSESADTGSSAPAGYYSTLNMNYTATYDGMKRMIEYVNNMSDRSTVPGITATYDASTDMITGTFTLSMYYLQNTDKEYKVPFGNSSSKGVDTIFGGGLGAGAPEANDTESETVE